jgi:hypothetical protein
MRLSSLKRFVALFKVDTTDAIALKVKQEFDAKEKASNESVAKVQPKPMKKAKAA